MCLFCHHLGGKIDTAYFILRVTGRARKYVVVWHKWVGPFHVSSGQQNCWLVPSLTRTEVMNVLNSTK